jgi:hypothetical protein
MQKQTTITYGTKDLVMSCRDGNITIKMGSESTTLSVWDFVQELRKIGIKRIPTKNNQCPM